jgi:hypothetical protein
MTAPPHRSGKDISETSPCPAWISAGAAVLALALSGCASESAAPASDEIDLAAKACEGVTDFAKWQLCKFNFNETIEATARDFRAQSAASPTFATRSRQAPRVGGFLGCGVTRSAPRLGLSL